MQRPSDDAEIARLVNAGMTASNIPHRLTQAQVKNWLDHPSNLDLAADLLFAEVNGSVVGYTEGGWEQDNDGGRNYSVWGQVHPDWQRHGLGTALLRWIEERQRRVAAGHPDVEKRLESWAGEAEAGRSRAARAERILDRALRLRDGAPEPRRHRAAAPAGRDRAAACARGGPAPPLGDRGRGLSRPLGRDRRQRGELRADADPIPRRDIGLWVVAWQGDEIVGQVLNRIDHEANAELGMKRGWVNSVGVRRAWRRQGVARALVAESLRVLRDAGMTSAGLGVDAENANGALGVYEATGFRVVRTERVYRKPI